MSLSRRAIDKNAFWRSTGYIIILNLSFVLTYESLSTRPVHILYTLPQNGRRIDKTFRRIDNVNPNRSTGLTTRIASVVTVSDNTHEGQTGGG
jgi:hypothetical protein